MKKALTLIICLVVIGSRAYCQEKNRGELNLNFYKGANEVVGTQLEGAGTYDADGVYGIGFSYLKPLNSWLDVEAGLYYSKHNIMFTSPLRPDGGRTFSRSNLRTVSLPVTFRVNILKYLFVNVGAMVDVETKHSMLDNQSGIGAMAGIGFRYSFAPQLSAFVNPFLQQHAIIPFRQANYQQRMLDAGLRFGVGFKS